MQDHRHSESEDDESIDVLDACTVRRASSKWAHKKLFFEAP